MEKNEALQKRIDEIKRYREANKKVNKKLSKDEILAKYFMPKANREEFRLVPKKIGGRFYDEAYFHVVPTTITGGKKRPWTPIYCLARNEPMIPLKDENGEFKYNEKGEKIMVPQECPLCKKREEILARQDPSVKFKKKEELSAAEQKILEKNNEIFKEASEWEARLFYIIRGIDRGVDKDGIKFWRVRHNFKKEGPMDKLNPVLEEYLLSHQADFASPENGTDIVIMMGDTEVRGKPSKRVVAISTKGPSKLSDDPVKMKALLDDPITWRDVFKPKKAPNITPKEYMVMLVKGKDPYYDESLKKWIFPDNPELEKMANTRDANLTEKNYDNYKQASDLEEDNNTTTESYNLPTEKPKPVVEKEAVVQKPEVDEKEEEPEDNNSKLNPTEESSDDNDNEETKATASSDDSTDSGDPDWDDLPF
jgi:hypothetical protein